MKCDVSYYHPPIKISFLRSFDSSEGEDPSVVLRRPVVTDLLDLLQVRYISKGEWGLMVVNAPTQSYKGPVDLGEYTEISVPGPTETQEGRVGEVLKPCILKNPERMGKPL